MEMIGFVGGRVIYYDSLRNIFFVSGRGRYWEFSSLWDLRAYIRNSSRKFILTTKMFSLNDLMENNPFKPV